MRISTLFTSVVLSLAALTTAQKSHDDNPVRDWDLKHIKKRYITSTRTFEETSAALEAAIPTLNTTAFELLRQGKTNEGLAALQALPALSKFIPVRNFTMLVTKDGPVGRKALQWEIGNPYTAAKFVSQDSGAALYAPLRVILVEDAKTPPTFEFDRPVDLFGLFKNKKIDEVAEVLDDQLNQLLLFAAGHPSKWPVPAMP